MRSSHVALGIGRCHQVWRWRGRYKGRVQLAPHELKVVVAHEEAEGLVRVRIRVRIRIQVRVRIRVRVRVRVRARARARVRASALLSAVGLSSTRARRAASRKTA